MRLINKRKENEMKLIEILNKLVELEDRIEIIGLSGKSLFLADSGKVPLRYLRCEVSKIKITGNFFQFTII